MTTHSSFGDLSAADFEAHATSIMNAHATSVERKQALAYLSSTLQKDRSAIEVEQKALSKRRKLRQRLRNRKKLSLAANVNQWKNPFALKAMVQLRTRHHNSQLLRLRKIILSLKKLKRKSQLSKMLSHQHR